LLKTTKIEETMRFLEAVWGQEECYVDLPSKIGGHWMPYNFLWPDYDLARGRVETALKNREDLYFSVARFKSKGRRYADTMPITWLWADLDMVDPDALEFKDLSPTIAWQSSEGRYQALWLLSREVEATKVEKINMRLTYHIGADRGGWDLTQVLRVPGTRNYKYGDGEGAEVKLLWIDPEVVYDPRELGMRLRDVKVTTVGEVPKHGLKAVRPREEIGARAKMLLRTPEGAVVLGERSDRLWELECLLAEAGRSEMEILQLVRETGWNKFKDDERRGEDRLRKDIRRAMAHVAQKMEREEVQEEVEEEGGEEEPEPARAQFVDYANFISSNIEAPKWLIEDIWTSDAHGLIAGEPKTQKSTLALAMGLAVASGKPFLNKYPVHVPGPVLMIQEENDPWIVQDRMRKIANSYGLLGSVEIQEAGEGDIGSEEIMVDFPPELPFKLLNNASWDMANEDNLNFLEEEVRETQPALVILDPLYLMIGSADTDRSQDIVPMLKWLLRLRFKYGCAILIIHHFRKQQAGHSSVKPGQRVMGSATFHGWVESALYCETIAEEEMDQGVVRLKVEREFRNVGPRRPLDLTLTMGEPGELEFEATVQDYSNAGQLLPFVEDYEKITAKQIADLAGPGWETMQVVRACQVDERFSVERSGRSWYISLNGD
jgi:hypothetical protein